MSHKPDHAYLQLHARFMIESRFTDIRPKSVHSPDLRHFMTIFPLTILLLFPGIDLPLDKIRVYSYALFVDTDRAKKAIPIDATGGYRQEQCPTNEIETDKKDAR